MEDRLEKLLETVNEIFGATNHDLITENANTNGKSPNGQLSIVASELAKEFVVDKLLSNDVRKAYENGMIHIHDMDFYGTGTTTCCQIPLGKILETGFYVGDCYMRKPTSITSAMALASIIVQANQNCQHGGQSFPNWDFDLAPYVEATYKKHFKELKAMNLTTNKHKLIRIAMQKTKNDLDQASEGFIHNCNSMLCRNGQQTPFLSINFGLDTSKWGRMVSQSIMEMQMKGLGNGATPIFPILIWKCKKGINVLQDDPNYDLYKLALECTSKRLFPNFVNVDAPFNLQYFDPAKPEHAIATMGCRTRVIGNNNGENTPVARGNLSFTTLNLPMIAMEFAKVNKIKVGKMGMTKDEKQAFINHLDKYIDLCIKQLKERLAYQMSRKAGNFQFLYQNGAWENGEKLGKNDEIGDILKTGTLSVGFIGLAEMLKLLTNKHHGESKRAYDFGYEVVAHIRARMDKQIEIDGLNWSCLATPSEGYCGKALRKFVAKYGVIKDVSDRDYFTNSNHVPVYYKIKAHEKIKLEAPFHELTNAGHICYIEIDGQASKNIEALDKIVQCMLENGVGYGSINHPVDSCLDCAEQGIFNDFVCTSCGSDNIQKVARITGYLVGDTKRWNSAKQSELKDRVKHN